MFEDDKLCLVPVQGSDTQWYKNVLKNPTIRIDARGAEAEIQAVPITDPKEVSSVVEKFREKYGKTEIKKYYFKVRRCRGRSDTVRVLLDLAATRRRARTSDGPLLQ